MNSWFPIFRGRYRGRNKEFIEIIFINYLKVEINVSVVYGGVCNIYIHIYII